MSIDEIPIKLYYITGLCLNILFSFFSIIITTYFKCIVNFKQHIKKKKKNLLTMYENLNNVCIKCIRIKKSNTIHCTICNLCIDNWDHHCFWLNCCITTKNKKIFIIFFILILLLLLSNMAFSVCLLLIYYKDQNTIYKIFTSFDESNTVIYNKYIYPYSFIIYLILFLLLFIYNLSLILFVKTSKKRKEIISTDTSSISEKNNYQVKLIDSYIDKNNDD